MLAQDLASIKALAISSSKLEHLVSITEKAGRLWNRGIYISNYIHMVWQSWYNNTYIYLLSTSDWIPTSTTYKNLYIIMIYRRPVLDLLFKIVLPYGWSLDNQLEHKFSIYTSRIKCLVFLVVYMYITKCDTNWTICRYFVAPTKLQ